jgi:hypothetical protein
LHTYFIGSTLYYWYLNNHDQEDRPPLGLFL